MPRLLRTVARTAAISGTATAVSGRVARRQAGRWAAQQPPPQAYAPAPVAQPAPAPAAPPPAAPAAPAAVSMDERLAQLKELGELRDSGVLTPAEFEAQKARLLSS